MTNTKFRKKALLASVAMLLVAMLALGSATFAWFAVNTKVSTADSINMTTKASTGIKIMSESEAALFGTGADRAAKVADGILKGTLYAQQNVYLDATTTSDTPLASRTGLSTNAGSHQITQPIIPNVDLTLLVSGTKWYNANGTNADDGSRNGAFSSGLSLGDGICYKENIYLMQTESTGTEKVKKITVDWDGSAAISPAMRVAVFAQDQTLLGIWSAAGNDIAAYDTTVETTNIAILNSKVAAKDTPITIAAANDSGSYVKTDGLVVAASAGATYVTVVIYMDGNDDDAISTNALNAGAAAILSGLDIDFSIVA